MDEKLKSENTQKEQFSEWGVGGNKILFASGGKGALTPLTKILRTLVDETGLSC